MAVNFFVVGLLLHCSTLISTLDNGLVQRPPMGWMSWARFTCQVDCSIYPNDCINERLFRDMADELVAGGYLGAGYEYVNIDDCWPEMTRDPNTNMIVANITRFPSGIPALSKYIHRKGLKFGKTELVTYIHQLKFVVIKECMVTLERRLVLVTLDSPKEPICRTISCLILNFLPNGVLIP